MRALVALEQLESQAKAIAERCLGGEPDDLAFHDRIQSPFDVASEDDQTAAGHIVYVRIISLMEKTRSSIPRSGITKRSPSGGIHPIPESRS